MLQKFLLPLGLVVFVSVLPLTARAESWNAYDDFWSSATSFSGQTKPNAWTYGTARSGDKDAIFSFTAFEQNNVELPIPAGGPIYQHRNSSGNDPTVARANSAWYPEAPPMPPNLFMHPGSGDQEGEYAIVRWQAPKSGTYKIDATFLASGAAGLKTVGVVHYDGRILKEELLKPTRINRQDPATTEASYKGSLKLNEKDFIAFYVGNGGDSNGSDAVGLDAVITLEK